MVAYELLAAIGVNTMYLIEGSGFSQVQVGFKPPTVSVLVICWALAADHWLHCVSELNLAI